MTDKPLRLDQRFVDEVRDRTSLGALVGHRVKLQRMGRDWKALCPFHDERTPSFVVREQARGGGSGFYHCYGCGAHGDCFEWVMKFDGCDFRAAVLLLADRAGIPLPGQEKAEANRESAALDGRRAAAFEPRQAREVERSNFVSSSTAGRWIFRTSGPARGEIVERYLESRGLDPALEPLPGFFAIDQLRFHPRCPVSAWRVDEEPESARLTAPAMVAPISDAEGAVWGVHVTFLAADGRGKAQFPLVQGRERPTRKMFGKVGGNAVFLTPPEAVSDAPLNVGEGIETTWSFIQQRVRPPARMAAALSLENLQGGMKRLRDGSVPLWKVEADPEKPPFVLPDAGDVFVLVDADMKPLRGQKVQLARGAKPIRADISGMQRAEICAELAAQAWRRAGARSVRCIRPRAGQDFNDSLRRVA